MKTLLALVVLFALCSTGCMISGNKFRQAFIDPLQNADYDVVNPALMTPYGKVSADSVRVRHVTKATNLVNDPLPALLNPTK